MRRTHMTAVGSGSQSLHEVVDELRDIATASLIENWIDETERRAWFLLESSRHGDKTGH